jgi:hypothetical protein
MDRLAALNVVGVAAIGMLALTALGLAFPGLVQGTAHPIPLWPQWQQLGHTKAEQLQALMAVMPVMIACYVAHQVRGWGWGLVCLIGHEMGVCALMRMDGWVPCRRTPEGLAV